MVHSGGQAQCDIASATVGFRELVLAKQILKRIPRAFDLQQVGAGDRSASADDGIARTDECVGI
jgi:hypothetical protein